MTFEEIVDKSDVILIEGGKKVGKLTFALHKCNNEKTIVVSSYQKSIFLKRLSAITHLKDENIQTVLGKMKFLTLKENWIEYKIKYGFDFLLEDIKRAIKNHQPRNIILHRLDLLFGTHINDNISSFMEKLIHIKEELECKLFITVNPSEDNENIIETIEDFSDLNVEIKKDKERIIFVKNSIFPIHPDKYYFLYKNDQIVIKPIDIQIKTSKTINILLITDKKDLIRTHTYLFDRKGFFVDIATSMSDTINKILSSPDIIVYNPKNDSLDLSVCNTIKQQKLPSHLIYITQTDYVRSEDKMKALQAGCYEIFPLNFTLGEYLLEIEKMLGKTFYTNILSKLSTNRTLTDMSQFCDVVESLYNERIYFTILKFESEEKPEDMRVKLRETDIIFKKNNKYILCLVNIRKSNIKPVLDKLFGENNTYVEIYDAPEWKDKREEICK